MDFLKTIEEYKKRTQFKVFSNRNVMTPVEPLRKNVIAISSVFANCSELPTAKRYEYAKMAGVKASDDGKYELENRYTEFEATEEVCLSLFNLKREEVDFSELNEGELSIAVALFFIRRKGI